MLTGRKLEEKREEAPVMSEFAGTKHRSVKTNQSTGYKKIKR